MEPCWKRARAQKNGRENAIGCAFNITCLIFFSCLATIMTITFDRCSILHSRWSYYSVFLLVYVTKWFAFKTFIYELTEIKKCLMHKIHHRRNSVTIETKHMEVYYFMLNYDYVKCFRSSLDTPKRNSFQRIWIDVLRQLYQMYLLFYLICLRIFESRFSISKCEDLLYIYPKMVMVIMFCVTKSVQYC